MKKNQAPDGIVVLSLFDGMSCGQQALERGGFKVSRYLASEVDKFAIKVTQANYPNTEQLGDVRFIDPDTLPFVDFLIGGSPCQSFSFAGKRKGMSTKDEEEILTLEHYLQLKEEGFEFEGESYLFWEYMRILTALRKRNPDIKFLLENVVMTEKWEKVLSKAIGVNPIKLNSMLVSAQSRPRLYWMNFGMQSGGLFGYAESIVVPPVDRNLKVKDILLPKVDKKYFLSDKAISSILLNTKNHTKSNINPDKSNALQSPGNACGAYKGASFIECDPVVHNMMSRSSKTGKGGSGHLTREDGKSYCLDTKSSMAVEVIAIRGRGSENTPSIESRIDGKSNCLTSVKKDNYVKTGSSIRKFTPVECERLQTVKDNYTNHVSDTQRYRMLGNGWTIEMIVHLFSYLTFPKISNHVKS